jgi:hypothetical protein
MGVRVSVSRTLTAVGESELFAVPDPHVAFLRRLSVTNLATAPATVQVVYYNGATAKPVLTLRVAPGGTLVLSEDELPLEGCPTRIAVVTDQQPLSVDTSLELE